MNLRVEVDGRGQTFKSSVSVDPKDIVDTTMRKQTHFWRQFIVRGQPKAFVQIKYKGNRDDEFIPPDSLDKSFQDNNVATDSTLNLVEMRSFHMPAESDAPDEEGEEEHEEMEEEIEEDQPVEEQPPLDKVETMAPLQHTVPNAVESKP